MAIFGGNFSKTVHLVAFAYLISWHLAGLTLQEKLYIFGKSANPIMAPDNKWQFWIDRGGTFTDVVARSPADALSSHKYLSVNPDQYEDAAVFAMRDIMGVPAHAPFPDAAVSAIKMGTTVATNALLEREGAKTLLLITKGFGDALLIGQQHRQDLFALKPSRPEPLYEGVIEVAERLNKKGDVLTPINVEGLRADLEAAKAEGYQSVAIAFVHGYRHQNHEKIAAELAREVGFGQVSVSHKISPLMKLVPRGDTTVADAYLSPILRSYVGDVRGATGATPLFFMQSNGGLAAADSFHGKDAVLSGPAGGIVGAAKSATREGIKQVIAFDMGGTSTDVSHYAGHYERVLDTAVAGVRMTVPMMDIHTVAAGGGSVCRFEAGRFQVGPQSAGAMPGPACYGRGGPITVTDCNLLLGKIQPHLFPSVFGKSGNEPLDKQASLCGFEAISDDILHATGTPMPVEAIAEGFLAVAVEHMARAIKRVSVERGHNIKDYTLLTFGGAGGQHACLVADALAIESVLVPPFAGVLSALGMGLADQRCLAEQALETSATNQTAITDVIKKVSIKAQRSLEEQGVEAGTHTTEVYLRVKYAGTDTALSLPFKDFSDLRATFETLHQQQFGFTESSTDLIVEAVEAEAIAAIGDDAISLTPDTSEPASFDNSPVFMNGEQSTAQTVSRAAIKVGDAVFGPAIIVENGSTTVIEPGWQATATNDSSLILRRVETRTAVEADTKKADPILLEIFNNLFMSVAEEMGAVLAKTAHSVNVKERLDFSCAVFDEQGRLIANAPHMPVHLGSMGESVTAIISARDGTMTAGDVFMINDPSAGGTHLPDITIVTPVFLNGHADTHAGPAFYVASRGHHADIGGITPGSMPPNSVTLEDEGICFTNFHLVKDDTFQTDAVLKRLKSHRFPARNPDQNIADLKAQVAANARGAALVRNLIDYYGIETVSAYMTFVRENAADAVRAVISTIKPGTFSYSMDCGATIAVNMAPSAEKSRLVIDFTGTSAQMPNNYNAPYAVVKAAVLYVFRVLAGGDIPLNDGCLEPIDIVVPEGCMLKPGPTAAVVAGNVETSQAITNALFLATGTLAAAQGTMNNLTFGNETYQYYETIAGGTGAGKGFDGTDAIQSHMTNSRMTDVEVLEWRYPVLVNQFGVRTNSGGHGQQCGGNGIIREFEFLETMEVSLLANHYASPPPGLNGGNDGQAGKAEIIRATGDIVAFKYADSSTVYSGDKIVIKTPGGGGFGALDKEQK